MGCRFITGSVVGLLWILGLLRALQWVYYEFQVYYGLCSGFIINFKLMTGFIDGCIIINSTFFTESIVVLLRFLVRGLLWFLLRGLLWFLVRRFIMVFTGFMWRLLQVKFKAYCIPKPQRNSLFKNFILYNSDLTLITNPIINQYTEIYIYLKPRKTRDIIDQYTEIYIYLKSRKTRDNKPTMEIQIYLKFRKTRDIINQYKEIYTYHKSRKTRDIMTNIRKYTYNLNP